MKRALLLASLLSACGESSAGDAGVIDASADASVADASTADGGAADAAVDPELAPPLGITFRDGDPGEGVIAGTVTLAGAADATGIDAYAIVGLDADGAIVGEPLASIPAAADPLAHTFAAGTPLPSGVVELAGVSVGAAGSSAPGPSTAADSFFRYSDVGGDGGADPLITPQLVRHAASGAVLAIGCDGQYRTTVRRCAPGSGCAEIATMGTAWGCSSSSAAVAGDALYVVSAGSSSTELHICALDGSGAPGDCRAHALASRMSDPSVAIGASALVIASADPTNDYRAAVDVCPLEGPSEEAPCTHHDVGAGQPEYSGLDSTALTQGDDVYVVTSAGVSHCALGSSGASGCTLSPTGLEPASPAAALRGARLYLSTGSTLRSCALDAGGALGACTSHALPGTSDRPNAILLADDGVYVMAQFIGLLVHCALDASGDPSVCSALEYSPPEGMSHPSLVEDGADILVVARAWRPAYPFDAPVLIRCTRDTSGVPTGCTHEDAAGPLGYHGQYARAFASPTHLYVASRFQSAYVLTSCALPIDEALASCVSRASPQFPSGPSSPSYSDGAVYLFSGPSEATLARCPLEADGSIGTECSTHDVRGGRNLRSVRVGHAIGGRVVAYADDYGNDYRPTLLACELDASGLPGACSSVMASAPGDLNSLAYGVTASATHVYGFIRESDGRIVYSCPLDDAGQLGEACTRTLVDPMTENSGYLADMIIAGGRLYLAHVDISYRPWLAVCELEGGVATSCATADVTAGSTESLYTVALAIAGERLYVGGSDPSARPSLIACDLSPEGMPSGCARHDASAGRGDGSASQSAGDLVIDPEGALYLVMADGTQRDRPAAYWIPAF